MKDGRLKLGRRNQHNHSTRANNDNNNSNCNISSSNKNNENKSRLTGSSKSSEILKAKWAWKKVPHKENESHSKKYNEKAYYWCKGHNLWCATNCNLLNNMKSSDDKDADNKTSSINSNAVSFASQMERILQE